MSFSGERDIGRLKEGRFVQTLVGTRGRTPQPRIGRLTARGEHAVFQGTGLYRYDPAAVAREGVIWRAINLFIGVLLLAAAIFLSDRNSLRGRVLLASLLFK